MCPHILLVAEGCSPQDLVQVLPGCVQVEATRVLLQILQERPLHKLEHQVPAATTLPHFQKVHQVAVTQLLCGERDESEEISICEFGFGCWMKTGKTFFKSNIFLLDASCPTC